MNCPHCKKPADAIVEHPHVIFWPNGFIVRCERCDVWTVVTK